MKSTVKQISCYKFPSEQLGQNLYIFLKTLILLKSILKVQTVTHLKIG